MRISRSVWIGAAGLLFAVAMAAVGEAHAAPVSKEQVSLEQQYQRTAEPELLYRLGVLAAREGRSADAIDCLRRYLADPQTNVEGPLAREAQKRQNELHAAGGELLVSGDKGAVVTVDEALRGILPLTMPLFLAVGEHTVVVRSGNNVLNRRIKIEHGRRTEVSFESSSRTVVVSDPPPIVVLLSAELLPPAVWRKLSSTIDRSVSRASLSPFLSEVALARVAPECRSAPTRPCLVELGRKSGLDFVLSAQLTTVPPTGSGLWKVEVQLLDSQIGDLAAREEGTIAVNTPHGLVETAELIDRVLTTGTLRPRGKLQVRSTPTGAEVFIENRAQGLTPFAGPAWAGNHDVRLHLSGYQDYRTTIAIADQQTAEITAELQALPVRSPRRPLYRIGVGTAAMAGGLLMIGFGAAALSIDGGCTMDPVAPVMVCPNLFNTQPLGAALLGVGAAVTVAGVLLVALPSHPARRRLQ